MKQVAPFGKPDGSKTKLPIPGGTSPITPASDSKKDTSTKDTTSQKKDSSTTISQKKDSSTTISQKKDSQESISKPLQPQLQLQQPISASQSASSSAKSPQLLGPPALVSAASWDGLNGKNPSTAQALPKDFVFAQPLALPPRDGPRRENQ